MKRVIAEYLLGHTYLPLDYRRNLYALIKEAIRRYDENLYRRYFDESLGFVTKPFTFSVFFPDSTKHLRDKFFVGKRLRLVFSSNDKELLYAVFEGLSMINEFKIHDIEGKVRSNVLYCLYVNFKDLPKINSYRIVFRTLSPVVLDKEARSGNYLSYDDPQFINSLVYSVRELSKTFLGKEDVDVEITVKGNTSKKPIWHYQHWVTGNKCLLEVKSSPDVLNLLYAIGIGHKRAQGFGMLEIVNE